MDPHFESSQHQQQRRHDPTVYTRLSQYQQPRRREGTMYARNSSRGGLNPTSQDSQQRQRHRPRNDAHIRTTAQMSSHDIPHSRSLIPNTQSLHQYRQMRRQRSQSDSSVGTMTTNTAPHSQSLKRQPHRMKGQKSQSISSLRDVATPSDQRGIWINMDHYSQSSLQQQRQRQQRRIHPSRHSHSSQQHHFPRQRQPSQTRPSWYAKNPRMWSQRLQNPAQTPQPRRGGLRKYPVACNKCRKPLAGIFFFLKCNCLFCEDCTYSHFNQNKNCPSCNRVMGEDDFKELRTLQPPVFRERKERIYRRLFLKAHGKLRYSNGHDSWNQLRRQLFHYRQGVRFTFRQFMSENRRQTKRAFGVHRALKALKGNQTLYEGEIKRLKLSEDGYKKQLAVADQKIHEQDQQLAQYYNMIESKDSTSSRSNKSHDELYWSGGKLETGHQSSTTARRSREPRRVSDMHHPHNFHARDKVIPYEQQHHHGHSTQPPTHRPSRTNPYEQQLDNKHGPCPSMKRPPHPSSRQHHRPQNARYQRSDVHNPYAKQSQAGGGTSVTSFSSGSATSGGKIRRITATTGFSFSGAAQGRKRQVSNHRHKHTLEL